MAPGRYRALLIANSMSRADPANFPELKGPKYDLVLMYRALVHPRLGLFGQNHVEILQERDHNQITAAMQRFFGSAQPTDQLLLYFSGHGDKDLSSHFYLCCGDTKKSELMTTGISDTLIDGLMSQSSAQSLVVILDCCYSGAAFKGGTALPGLKSSGVFVLQSSGAAQTSYDAAQETEASAFTRHLVDALLSGREVSFDDIFDYVSDRLRETGQVAHRKVKGAGNVLLARALPRTVLVPEPTVGVPPRLKLSRTAIELRDVAAGSTIPPETIEVLNVGGGTLNWTVRSEATWITVDREANEFRLHLMPPPGRSQGVVRVDDRASGTTALVRVTVTVLEPTEEVGLTVSLPDLDFGVLSQGAASPRQTIHLGFTGVSELNASVSVDRDWIDAQLIGDLIVVAVRTHAVGNLAGEVTVTSHAGTARIGVHAVVEQGPLLGVEPTLLDLGRVEEPGADEHTVRVFNQGKGELLWQHGSTAEFFTVSRVGDELRLRLVPKPGLHLGSIWLTSNGGSANVDVRAEIAVPPPPEPASAAKASPPRGPGGAEGVTTRLRAAELAIYRGHDAYVFTPARPAVIGRDLTCDVRMENPAVSLRHATLTWEGNRWVLSGTGSDGAIFHHDEQIDRLVIRDVTTVWVGAVGTGEQLLLVPGSRSRLSAKDVQPPDADHLRVWRHDAVVDFAPPGPVTFGRDRASDVGLENQFVSSRHAEARFEGDRWVLQDIGSRRGTFHGEQQIQSLQLCDATVVTFGPTQCGERLVLVPGPATPSPEPPPPDVPDAGKRRRPVVHYLLITLVIVLLLAVLL